METRRIACAAIALGAVIAVIFNLQVASSEPANRYIVTMESAEHAARAVTAVGGMVVRRLDAIDAVGAELTPTQRRALAEHHTRSVWLGNDKQFEWLVWLIS